MLRLTYLEEPTLEFGHGQSVEDPRDGLTLFGPLDEGKPYGIRAGVIGTRDGVKRFSRWVASLSAPILESEGNLVRPHFPGFEAAFGIPWSATPSVVREISGRELSEVLRISDGNLRVFKAVSMYADKIAEVSRNEDAGVDIWFVVIPDEVYEYGRPESRVEPSTRIVPENRLSRSYVRQMQTNYTLFAEDVDLAEPYHYKVHFRDQIKARFLNNPVPIQVVRESTVARNDFLDSRGNPKRQLDAESAVAWNLSCSTFYKVGGRPWKLGAVRRGVCYVGMAFKEQTVAVGGDGNACCAAQMFLDSGDGVVFKGAVGPWHNSTRGDFHLSRAAARDLMEMAVSSYKDRMGTAPEQVFVHGKVRFDDDEWNGFVDGAGNASEVVGVYMRESRDLKLFRKGRYPVMRGLAQIWDGRSGHLWTNGFIPRLGTYPGWEVPWALYVEVSRGDCEIEVVLRDVLALTKLNYNTCIYGDGMPVTLRFADAVGDVLTAGPLGDIPPLAFRYYI